MTAPFLHRPVMADEVVELLRPVPPGVVVDATVGGGGHARRLLEARPDLRILGLDRDPRALAAAAANLAPFGDRVTLVRSRFDHLEQIMSDLAIDDLSGALFDLGVSSPQLDERRSGLLVPLGRPPGHAHGPRRAVVGHRRRQRLPARPSWPTCWRPTATSATPGASRTPSWRPVPSRPRPSWPAIVAGAIPAPARRRGGHPAKRTFQAIRIEVNRELDVLPGALDAGHRAGPARRPGRRAGLPLR